jgi:hypothetical protein
MTVWLPYLDHPKTYRGVIEDMKKNVPAGACVASRGLTEPQRAMFHYFAGITSLPETDRCNALLVHTGSAVEPAHGNEWQLVWHGTRPGDDKEYFWLFARP